MKPAWGETAARVKDEISYIENMSSDLAKMAKNLDNPFLAYLLTMVSLQAREERLKYE